MHTLIILATHTGRFTRLTQKGGRVTIGGHDITSPLELLQSFDHAYGKLKGDVALASNQFGEATHDIKTRHKNEFKEQHFSLGGLLETYR